jgi:uncharacterized protein (TIGR02118 family)
MRLVPTRWVVPSLVLVVAACGKPPEKAQETPGADTAAPAAQPAAPAGPQGIITVLYQTPKDTAAFEKYYAATHLPIVSAGQPEIGFVRADLTKFVPNDTTPPAKYRQAELCFNSMADLKKGIATPAFKKVGDDFKNFVTNGLTALIGEQK